MKQLKRIALGCLLFVLAVLVLAGCGTKDNQINEVPAEDTYGYVNPDESKAETDTGIVIDGVLEEEVYQNNNWLYLHNDDGGNNVNIAMTSYYGEKGMYFVYDVTESVPIYVNTKRNSYMNSCIEMYLAPSYLSGVQDNSVFEIDMLPTGDMVFKKSNGQYGYTNVATTNDKMAVLGATTKGGAVNTPECYGYCLELFIPWDYMTWLDMDVQAMQDGFVYVNPAHITSNNHDGTDSNLDRYWYFFAQQNGAEFTDVSQYFRFDGEGVIGTVPVVLEKGENCTVTGAPNVIPGMNTVVKIVPDEGYALTSIIVNGEEKIQNASFNEDGSVTLTVRGTTDGVTVSAKAEVVVEGTKNLSGKILLNNINWDSFDGLLLTYIGPKGERPLEIGADGKFELKDMEQGYYVLKAEKEGYNSVNRGIYLNQDFYTELVLEYNYFQITQGSCWILEKQNNGVIYKMGGNGALMSNKSYNNFDYSVNLRYDTELAKLGDSDYFDQQRSGMRIEFGNGKTWHIDLMKEKDKYILQYARFSGDNSVTQWRTVRVLNNAEIAKYQSKAGIRLRIMRQGQYMAVWLDNTLLVIEMFGDQYNTCTAKLGMEVWIANRTMMEIPFKISANLPVDVAGSPFHWPAEIWDISNQYNGTFTKFPAPGKDTWLDGKILCNDITTTCKDLSPEKKDYSMIYIFKFSNNESFRLRLNHTDKDGKFRVQSFAGSTLTPTWKNYYTLTDEQAQKAITTGVDYRVWISGTNAYVYIDGTYACAIDLSKNVKTGAPSGIENATSTVSFRLDGNTKGNTVISFKMAVNNDTPPEIIVPPSEISHNDFTATAYLKYDKALQAQGTTDEHVQQRSGMKISFSNGKNWHVHMMKEDDRYIVQYAKMSGDNSVFNWRTAHVLTEAEAAQYESAEGIRLQIMRQGRHAAVWLGETLLVIELLGEEYLDTTAKLSAEAWISGQSAEDVILNTADGVPVDVAGSPFHWPAGIWDISNQYNGTITKHPAPGKDTWLDSKIISNDVTTIAKDQSPQSNDYSLLYIFKFSNGENFRVRLNHTDDDGKYRIQSFANSTLFEPWKNHYTLTEEESQKVITDGVSYRVQILGTTAYVFIDGKAVCTYDLSTNIKTGQPSGIENATSTVSFRLDGNLNGNTVIPFWLENNSKNVTLNIAATENGTVTAEKSVYQLGDTVKLAVKGADGYHYSELMVDGMPVVLDWDGTYSFEATKNRYDIAASFAPGVFADNSESAWNLTNQNTGLLMMQSHDSGNSGFVSAIGMTNDVSTVVKDLTPEAKDFSMIYNFTFSNGETFNLRLNHTDDDGRYRIQSMSGSTLFAAWKNAYTLNDAEAAKVQGDGIQFQVVIRGTTAHVCLDGIETCTYDLSKVVASGQPSDIQNETVSVAIRMDGNLNQDVVIPFRAVDASVFVELIMDAFENGSVIANQTVYRLGDTVTFTIAPDFGYSQKLTIDGEPLLLDWKTNTYSFVAEKNSYVIGGSFEKSLQVAPSDAGRWDSSNQAHGILSTYYPSNNDSWWYKINGEYEFLAVNAKNYLPQADSAEGSGTTGFSVVLAVTMDNGKTYGFRILNEKENGNGAPRYIYTRFGAGGCVTGWSGWCLLESKVPGVTEKLQGDGAEFKLTRTGANKLQVTLDGVTLDTYTMDGVTSANKVTSFGIYHYGNKGQMVDIPFTVDNNPDAAPVTVIIPALENGTITADKEGYQLGDTVTLTVAPNDGYSQKLTIDGKPLLLDWKTNSYSFVAEKESYVVGGSFEKSLQVAPSDAGRWDSSNQAHGILSTYYPNNNDSWWGKINGNYEFLAVNAKNYLPQADSAEGSGTTGFSVVLAVTLDNGKTYGFRILNEKENGNGTARYIYTRYGAGGCVTGWSGWCLPESKVPGVTEKLQGDGAEFKLTRTGANKLQVTLDGVVLDTYTMDGVTASNQVTSFGIYHYGNRGQKVQIPFAVTSNSDAAPVTITIPTLTNGTVTTNKQSYRVGDTITLTVAPKSGYSQKLTLDGKPVLLDWKTNSYSFVAEKESYVIGGSFVPSLQETPSDAGRWDSSNQAHGILSTYYPNNNDSWWYKLNGNYNSIAVNAKNYLPQADSAEGGGKIGYAFTLAITLDNGKTYGFRIINERENGNGNPRYIYTRFGASGCVTGWGGWCLLESKIPGITEKLQGDGAEFKLTRTGANTLQVTLDGVVLDTYTMDGVTSANKVTSVGIYHYGNKGQVVQIPFVLTPAPDSKELG